MNDSRDELVKDIAQEGIRLAIATRNAAAETREERDAGVDLTDAQDAQIEQEVIERTEEVVQEINDALGRLAPELQDIALARMKHDLDYNDHNVDSVQGFVHDIAQRVQKIRELSAFETNEEAMNAMLLASTIEINFPEESDNDEVMKEWIRRYEASGLKFEKMSEATLRISCQDKLGNHVDKRDITAFKDDDEMYADYDALPLITNLNKKIEEGSVRIIE